MKPNKPETPEASESIIDVSAQISHEIVDGAKDRANELIHLPLMVLKFLRGPFKFIQTTPDLKTVSWVVLAVTSGILGAAVNAFIYQSVIRFVVALIVLPLGAFLSVFATTSILKLVFRGAHGLRFRYRSGASIFAFSNMFWWIPIGAGEKFPPVLFLGFGMALAIAARGFSTKLGLPAKLVARWFTLIALAHATLWWLGSWLSGQK